MIVEVWGVPGRRSSSLDCLEFDKVAPTKRVGEIFRRKNILVSVSDTKTSTVGIFFKPSVRNTINSTWIQTRQIIPTVGCLSNKTEF